MHQRRSVRQTLPRFVSPTLTAAALAVVVIVLAGNSNPLCAFVPRYSLEWYVMFCNYTEIPDPQG